MIIIEVFLYLMGYIHYLIMLLCIHVMIICIPWTCNLDLFHILLNRKVPFCIIRLLMDSFERQRARVMWNSHVSDYFSISNGVKQGGVISPVMLN